MLKRVKFKVVVYEIGYFEYPIFFWKKTVIGLHRFIGKVTKFI